MSDSFQRLATAIQEWASQHSVIRCVSLFGSVVRGNPKEGSDFDVLFDFDDVGCGFADFALLEGTRDWRGEFRALVAGEFSQKVSFHYQPDDPAWEYVSRGEIIFEIGKVRVVRTELRAETSS